MTDVGGFPQKIEYVTIRKDVYDKLLNDLKEITDAMELMIAEAKYHANRAQAALLEVRRNL